MIDELQFVLLHLLGILGYSQSVDHWLDVTTHKAIRSYTVMPMR